MRKAWNVAPLGGCCWCGGSVNECRSVGMVHKKAPIAGTGWGCFQCGLPNDGAMAIACDQCVASGETSARNPREICVGNPGETALRAPFNELSEAFEHDLSKHPELQPPAPPEPTDVRMLTIPVMRRDIDGCAAWLEEQLVRDGQVKPVEEYTAVERMLSNILGALEPTEPGVCKICGCTDDHACEGGCFWVNPDETICSSCAMTLL